MLAQTVSREDLIRARAHTLWLAEGCPDGRAEAHWQRAAELVDAESESAKPAAAPLKKVKAAPRKRS